MKVVNQGYPKRKENKTMKSNIKFIQSICNNGIYNNGTNLKELVSSNLEKFIFNQMSGEQTFDVEFDVIDEFEKLFNRVCKGEGRSETKFGEIIRGLMKLCYRYKNDGDDIETGPYSGIWHGLVNELDCPFTAFDYGVEWDCMYFEKLNAYLSHAMGRDYVKNIALNALILETFEINGRNHIDIADYYKNIVHFIMSENVINKFAEYGLDVTKNFGTYDTSVIRNRSDKVSINSIYEDIHIDIEDGEVTISNKWLNISFDWKDVDEVLGEYQEVLKYMFHLATVEYKRTVYDSEIKEAIGKFGFDLINGNIVKK